MTVDTSKVPATTSLLSGSFEAVEVAKTDDSQPEVTVHEDDPEDPGKDSVVNDDDSGDFSSFRDWMDRHRPRNALPARYRLVTDEEARRSSLRSLRYAVLCAAVNTKILNPNYPLMVSDVHPEAFPTTEPFNFNSATYFIPMCSLLGVAISSVFLGQISDRLGRKNVIIFLSAVSCGGSIAKYFARHNFYLFCLMNFIFGLFLGNLPVGMAYVGDVFTSKKQKETQLGTLVAFYVIGNSGGGVIAILMESTGLFTPLWVGAAMIGLSAILSAVYMIEPGDERMSPIGKDAVADAEMEENEGKRPETIEQCTMWNVVLGALADNVGSTGLFPLCLSPLALEQYTLNFINADPPQEPIMSITGYKWLSVMVAAMVVPSTMVTPYLFNWIGVAGTCVLGNSFTALVTMALLFIGGYAPATTAAFAGFVIVLYGGFPCTVWSQLTTGPMLDVLAPEDKIGFVQGLNNSSMNFGMALAPFLFGLLADATTTNTAIWTGIGISVMAALINSPLTRDDRMGPPPKVEPPQKRVLAGEDEETVKRAIRGDFVPPDVLWSINRNRLRNGRPRIVPSVKPYDEDKEGLAELLEQAEENFRFRRELCDRTLSELDNPRSDGMDVDELCRLVNLANAGDPDGIQQHTDDVGKWIGQYLKESGYYPHVNSLIIKQMILSAFPVINEDEELNPDNMRGALVRTRQVMNEYLALHEEHQKYGLVRILGTGTSAYVAYS